MPREFPPLNPKYKRKLPVVYPHRRLLSQRSPETLKGRVARCQMFSPADAPRGSAEDVWPGVFIRHDDAREARIADYWAQFEKRLEAA